MMVDSPAVAERPSPTVQRARQTASAAFPRASAAALAMVSLHVLACVFMILLLSEHWLEDVKRSFRCEIRWKAVKNLFFMVHSSPHTVICFLWPEFAA
jgi:hypothetical protein